MLGVLEELDTFAAGAARAAGAAAAGAARAGAAGAAGAAAPRALQSAVRAWLSFGEPSPAEILGFQIV